MNQLRVENDLITQGITSWEPKKLLGYIQEKLSVPLNAVDAEKFLEAQIDGSVFLFGAGDRSFFQNASLSFGSSVKLAGLSENIAGRYRNSEQAGLTWPCDHIFKKLQSECEIDTVVRELSSLTSQRRSQIYHECLPLSKEMLSDPAFMTKLPFPFVFNTLPNRFKFESKNNEHNWIYTGREKFAELLDKFQEICKSPHNSGFWLHGTRGYGKSHLLAALVCYLTARGERIVYIPDCHECMKDPVSYIKTAMLFAWADDDDQRESIILLKTMEAIYRYFLRARNTIFVIDQLNALGCMTGDSPEQEEKKGKLETWLLKYRARHKSILSASANFNTYLQTQSTQTSELQLHVYGGLTAKEMNHWWERNSAIILEVNGEVDLGVAVLRKVWKQAESYCEYVNACIRHQATPTSVDPKLIDHRYFYERCPTSATPYEIGAYVCGIARDAVVKQLRKFGENKFADRDFLKSIDEYINNEAVIGFFIEENILSTIALRGLEIGRNISQSMDMQMFQRFPTFSITERPILYCPMQFNFRAIDGIIVRFDLSNGVNGKKGKCFMFPLQITIAKSHADSEYEFFKDWIEWIKDLDHYDLEVVFLWISAKKPWERKVKRYPEYISKNVHISDVNRDTWERYDRALKSKNGRGQTKAMVPQKRGLRKQDMREQEVVKDESEIQRVTKATKRRRTNRAVSKDGVEGSDGVSIWAGRTRSAPSQ
ncbi:hypothetical protein B9Z19DRAFT_1125584 [Tuber borchii]|uniref:Uncharacterized protein n=1 Tax=Tuber borchii TaxID=42251 RepID=A0A2T6ZUP9_TUBBO|nr:hypothetical protein B9Z19DRAFT_1125584 [Tuber borchii]